MEPHLFNKSFFKFLFGFIVIIIFGLFGAVVSSRFFDSGGSMFANSSETR
jgi:hypothetical protein